MKVTIIGDSVKFEPQIISGSPPGDAEEADGEPCSVSVPKVAREAIAILKYAKAAGVAAGDLPLLIQIMGVLPK